MGAFRLFARMASRVAKDPNLATEADLGQIAGSYGDFSYIGGRSTLSGLVVAQAELLGPRVASLTNEQVQQLATVDDAAAASAKAAKPLLASGSGVDMPALWFGGGWKKDSGVFPDFVLAEDGDLTFGNGAVLELKDTAGEGVSSFNSTIPTSSKSLGEVHSRMVTRAALLRDLPGSLRAGYLARKRACLYLVRTRKNNANAVRVSLVAGHFFETVPKETLMEGVWDQILEECGTPDSERPGIIKRLAKLSQGEIVRSRTVPGASVKPRLRLMAEVHADANPHRYDEIGPRTVNIVFRNTPPCTWEWLENEFSRDGLVFTKVQGAENGALLGIPGGDASLHLHVNIMNHKLNGEHVVLQYRMGAS